MHKLTNSTTKQESSVSYDLEMANASLLRYQDIGSFIQEKMHA